MTAPEEQHIVGLGRTDDVGQTVGSTAQKDVAQVVGTAEVAEMVVDHSVLADVGIHQRVVGVGLCRAVDVDLARLGVLRVVGQVILDNQHDMVIVVAVMPQQLVDGEGIGLMTVVVPGGRGTHHYRPTLARGGQIQTGIGTEVGVDIENLTLPVPDVLHGETAVLCGRDDSVWNIGAVAW